MSKIEAGSLKLFIEPNVDLNGILRSLAATGKTLLGDKPVELRLDIAADLPTIQGDRQRILQILLNVLSNACKFTQAGYIRIRANAVGSEVIFVIEDTGPGIAPEDQALVFEAFKQTETGLRQGGGTGLGMPISRSLVEAHGGRLWLESQPGKGSSFYVALPLQAQSPELVALI
jgi:Signal transduction histidine kinase